MQLCLGICACAVRHAGWEASKVLPDMVMYCQKQSGDRGHGDPGPRVLMLELLKVGSTGRRIIGTGGGKERKQRKIDRQRARQRQTDKLRETTRESVRERAGRGHGVVSCTR